MERAEFLDQNRLPACLRFQRGQLRFAPRRHYRNFAAAFIGDNNAERLALAFEE